MLNFGCCRFGFRIFFTKIRIFVFVFIVLVFVIRFFVVVSCVAQLSEGSRGFCGDRDR